MPYQHLKKWTTPRYYLGEEYPDWYVVIGHSRGSHLLDHVNFDSVLKALGGESDTVQVVRASHFASGWVEWIGVHESDVKSLEKAEALMKQLDDYPILDEEEFTMREDEAADALWKEMGSDERKQLLQENGEDPRLYRLAYHRLYDKAPMTEDKIRILATE